MEKITKKEYLVYHELDNKLLGNPTIIKKFKSHEEALNYALSMRIDLTIYEAVTNVFLTHEIEDIEE